METVLGAGYQGRSLSQFLADLTAQGILEVVDVRLHPFSRKQGFSKRALAAALADVGIGYRHEPALGNPRDNRSGFAGDADERRVAHQRYMDCLEEPAAQRALTAIAETARVARTAVLCFEADQEQCHRALVLARLRSDCENRAGSFGRSGRRP